MVIIKQRDPFDCWTTDVIDSVGPADQDYWLDSNWNRTTHLLVEQQQPKLKDQRGLLIYLLRVIDCWPDYSIHTLLLYTVAYTME